MLSGNVNTKFFKEQTALLPKPLAAALCFLKETDLAHHEPGKFDITLANVPMVLQVIDQNTAPRESLRPEIHRRNIDVQFLAAGGPEEAGFFNDDGTNTVDEDLLATPRDILFYKNDFSKPESRLLLTVGTYAVYFPWDAHIPAIQVGSAPAAIRKIVIKVPLEACLEV